PLPTRSRTRKHKQGSASRRQAKPKPPKRLSHRIHPRRMILPSLPDAITTTLSLHIANPVTSPVAQARILSLRLFPSSPPKNKRLSFRGRFLSEEPAFSSLEVAVM